MYKMESSIQSTDHDLAWVRNFLSSLANLPDQSDAPAVRRFKLHFSDFFQTEIPWTLVRHWAVRVEEEDVVDLSEDEQLWRYWLLPLRNAVRAVWVSPDLRIKQWGVFRILQKYFLVGDRSLSVGPIHDDAEWFVGSLGPPSPSESALMHLVGFAKLTKICANSECATPYFVATRRSQKHCSSPCARPAQRSSKRSWWAAKGAAWRRKRAEEQRRRSRRSATGKPVEKARRGNRKELEDS
jgi:hypothetical protein